MARFDVYSNPDGGGYLLDVQSDILSRHLNTRIAVPLMPLDTAPKPATVLNPIVDIDGVKHSMATQYLAAVPERMLKNIVLNASDRRDEILAALDMLLQGY